MQMPNPLWLSASDGVRVLLEDAQIASDLWQAARLQAQTEMGVNGDADFNAAVDQRADRIHRGLVAIQVAMITSPEMSPAIHGTSEQPRTRPASDRVGGTS